MFISKKAQQAVEFMLILVFVMGLIAGAMYVSGVFLGGFKDQENVNLINNFVDNVNKEIDILSKVEYGYYRELEIFSSRYDVNLTADGSLLIIKDLANNNDTFYFDLLENPDFIVKLDFREIDGVNMTILIFEKLEDNDYQGLALDYNSTITSNPIGYPEFNATFKASCGLDLEVYRLDNFNESHAQIATAIIPSYPIYSSYRLCLEHNNYVLGTDCSAPISKRLFYLGNVTNSHMWLDNLTAQVEPYADYYDWQEVCISSNAGTITIDRSQSDLSADYECVGSYYEGADATYGYSLGDCNDYIPAYTKIWVKIE